MSELSTLTADERVELERCEAVIKKNLDAWIEVGTALITIREKHLWRGDYKTWSAYLKARWKMTRQRAKQLSDGVGVQQRVEASTLLTVGSEYVARELGKFEPELQPAIMRIADSTAKALGKPVNGGMVKRVGEVITQAAVTGAVDVMGVATPLTGAVLENEFEAVMRQKAHLVDAAVAKAERNGTERVITYQKGVIKAVNVIPGILYVMIHPDEADKLEVGDTVYVTIDRKIKEQRKAS